MYLSGTIYNFESRLHKFPTSGEDLALFKLEAYNQNYTGLAPKYEKNQWSKEFIKKSWSIFSFPTGNVFP